mgnify:CR=1 FL=1
MFSATVLPVTVTTSAGGYALVSTTAPTIPLGKFITATATDPVNNTSEFAACVPVTATGPVDSDGDGYSDALETALGKNPTQYCAVMRADVNMDGVVSVVDLSLVGMQFLQTIPPGNPRYDQGPPPEFDWGVQLR